MTPKELGQILRAKRKEARLSSVQLGELLGCSHANITQYERGKRWPSIEFLRDFESAFSLSEGELSQYSNRHKIYVPPNRARKNNNALAQLRVKCGLTQKEVADIFLISRGTLSAIEQERYYILSNEIKQLIPQIKKYLRNLALVKKER